MPILENPPEFDTYLSRFLERLDATRHYLTHFSEQQKTLAFSSSEIEDTALVCWAVLTYWMSLELGLGINRAGQPAIKAKNAMFLVQPRSNM